MLRELHIRNFAVIESLDLDFNANMTVFTGETGAGKSIIVDAVGLILGDRGDSSVVRHDQNQTELSAVFTIANNPTAATLLKDADIETEQDEVIIRRVISREGRTRAFINGTPVTVQQLKQLGECLVELYGQHAHQTLLKPAEQRRLLDGYGDYDSLLTDTAKLHQQWQLCEQQLQQLSGNDEQREARLALLSYQVNELKELALTDNEYAELDARQRQLSHINQIQQTLEIAQTELHEDDQSALGLCTKHLQRLQTLSEQDKKLAPLTELLANAEIQLQELRAELRDYVEQLDTDPASLEQVEQRLDLIIDTARKHHVKPEDLYEQAAQLEHQLQSMLATGQTHAELLKQQQQILAAYTDKAAQLTQQRQKSAIKLAKKIKQQLHQLGMPSAEFKIDIQDNPAAAPTAHGNDAIRFLFSANPGQEVKPLNKVASGGELSRIGLALQVTASQSLTANTLIFDEVDAGIGGATASIVGKLLSQLGQHYQIFCVTHLAQVGACAQQHFHVAKMAGKNVTRTQVRVLDAAGREQEIARMMGGVDITEQSLAHARELLSVE